MIKGERRQQDEGCCLLLLLLLLLKLLLYVFPSSVFVFIVMSKVPDSEKEKVQIISGAEMIKGERRRRDEVCSNQKI